jgi:hypothetical protein
MAVLGDKLEARRSDCTPLAGKATLNRLELSRLEPSRYHKISYDAAATEALFVDVFLDAHAVPPPLIILDLEATDDPLHGHQEGRFFQGYYGNYCYLPLCVFCGRHPLVAKLRSGNIDAGAGSVEEMARIVAQIRQGWPKVRADSGFARDALMASCENNDVDFLFGLAKNARLKAEIETNSPRRKSRANAPASRHAASRTLLGGRSRAGAASAGSSPRRNGPAARLIRASSSPRWRARSTRPATSARSSTARAVKRRTATRSVSSTFMPTAPRPIQCAPTYCACGSPQWPMC